MTGAVVAGLVFLALALLVPRFGADSRPGFGDDDPSDPPFWSRR